jgi:hypothetical protein
MYLFNPSISAAPMPKCKGILPIIDIIVADWNKTIRVAKQFVYTTFVRLKGNRNYIEWNQFLGASTEMLKCIARSIILLSGDIHPNPGPVETIEHLKTQLSKHKKNIKVLHLNAQSISKKWTCYRSFVEQLDDNTILMINETWLSNNDSDNNWIFDKEKYILLRKDRDIQRAKKSRGGGSMILIPRVLNPSRRTDLEIEPHNTESLWVEINVCQKKILLNLAYNPPDNPQSKLIELLEKSIDRAVIENKPLVICGDYNINILNNINSSKINKLVNPYGLTILNQTSATRITGKTGTLIDLSISEKKEVHDTIVSEAPISSDHLMTSVILKHERNESAQEKRTKRIQYHDKSNYSKDAFTNHIAHADFSHVYKYINPDKALRAFEYSFYNIVNHHCPWKTKYIRNKKCTNVQANTHDIRRLSEDKKRKLFDYKSNPTDDKWLIYKTSRNKLNNKIKYVHESTKKFIFSNLNTMKKKWNFINQLRQVRNTEDKIENLKNSLGYDVNENKKMANLMNYKFSVLGEYEGPSVEYKGKCPNNRNFNFRFVTAYEVNKSINKLNANKPKGPGKIPAWAIKDAQISVAPILTYIINQSIKMNVFPDSLKHEHITPVHKKGPKTEPENYRPIAIISPISKIFEMCLSNQMVEYLTTKNVLSSSQFGFQRGKSANDAIVYLTEKIRLELDRGNNVYAAFLDLSKAFNSIDHIVLKEKLKEIGFRDESITLVSNYLSNRRQRTKVNDTLSDVIETNIGVPQGTILGPLIFLIYVYDIAETNGLKCEIIQYADDTALFFSGKDDIEATETLNNDLSILVDYFKSNKLKLNATKTEYIIFTNSKKTSDSALCINGIEVTEKSNAKYLGVILDKRLTYQKQIEKIMNSMAAGIKTIYCIRDYLPQKTCHELFNAIVLSHLSYPAILFSGITAKQCESIDKQISWGIKCCYIRATRSSSFKIKSEKGVLPAELIIKSKMMEFLWKMINKKILSFQSGNFPFHRLKTNPRTDNILVDMKIKTNLQKKSIIKRAVNLQNTFPKNIWNESNSVSFKRKLKQFLLQVYRSRPPDRITSSKWNDDVWF